MKITHRAPLSSAPLRHSRAGGNPSHTGSAGVPPASGFLPPRRRGGFEPRLSLVLGNRKRAVVTAGLALLTLGLFLARPAVAQAAGVDDETQFVFNTFAFLVWGSLGDVDVRRVHDAGVRRGAHKERLDDLPEERRHLLDRRTRLLLRRLQPHVRRGRERPQPLRRRLRRAHRLVQAPPRTVGR